MFGPLSAKMWGAALAKTRRRAGVKKAGERAGVVNAPARPLLPAVRAVSGDENGAFLRLSNVE